MSGNWNPTGRARVSARSPRAIGVCDRCGTWYNHNQLRQQVIVAGTGFQTIPLLVCYRCYDIPNLNLLTILIPPDPIPIYNPRPEQYDVEVPSFLMVENRSTLLTESGSALIWEIKDTPNPDPNNPADYPP